MTIFFGLLACFVGVVAVGVVLDMFRDAKRLDDKDWMEFEKDLHLRHLDSINRGPK
jgi:hypothetical protein